MTARKPTVFEERVYAALRQVPRGRVTTYAALARRIGCGSPRAVGQALRRNPHAPDVPCHRVIASDRTPGGFAGERAGPALQRKLALLEEEGVSFAGGRLSNPGQIYWFEGSAHEPFTGP
jgi:methylated-DNA-[protein]-cysteine S-methyltransferase